MKLLTDTQLKKFQSYLLESILTTYSTEVSNALTLASILEGGVSARFFDYLELNNSQIFSLTSCTIFQFNEKEQCYIIHNSVRDTICARLENRQLLSMHLHAAKYIEHIHSHLHLDDKSRHFEERRRIVHLIKARCFDEASVSLGKIGTRYLSFNDASELKILIQRLRSQDLSEASQAWLLNVEAHIGDFKRSFNETQNLYRKMLDLSIRSKNLELLCLSNSNFATTKRRSGNFKGALSDYWKAYRLATRLENKKMLGSILNNIGQTYTYMYENIRSEIKMG